MTIRTPTRTSPATSRNASSPTIARPAERSRSNTSRWSGTPATRQTCRRSATRSSAWRHSWRSTSKYPRSCSCSPAPSSGRRASAQERHDKQRHDRDVEQYAEKDDETDVRVREEAGPAFVGEHPEGERQKQYDRSHKPRIIDTKSQRRGDMGKAIDQGQPDPGEAKP